MTYGLLGYCGVWMQWQVDMPDSQGKALCLPVMSLMVDSETIEIQEDTREPHVVAKDAVHGSLILPCASG